MRDIIVTQSRRSRKNKELAISRRALFGGMKSIVYIAAWAFLLYVLQPFITAAVWWKGYQILLENALSLSVINTIFTVIEYIVCFAMVTLLAMLSWSEWNRWRLSRPVQISLFVRLLK